MGALIYRTGARSRTQPSDAIEDEDKVIPTGKQMQPFARRTQTTQRSHHLLDRRPTTAAIHTQTGTNTRTLRFIAHTRALARTHARTRTRYACATGEFVLTRTKRHAGTTHQRTRTLTNRAQRHRRSVRRTRSSQQHQAPPPTPPAAATQQHHQTPVPARARRISGAAGVKCTPCSRASSAACL